ncbi:MAG: hypothetical protein J6W00_14705 [Lentisphaeria bacterium]|nr:hypothetical protein [Lentisphaeria bacterium]
MEYEKHCKESSTTAKTALGLSIGALGVELLGANGGGILSGLLGKPQTATVTAEMLPLIMAMIPMLNQRGYCCNDGVVSALEAKIANLESKLYSNDVGINTFKESAVLVEKMDNRYSDMFRNLNEEAVNNRVAAARQEEQIKCLQKEFDYKLNAVEAKLTSDMRMGFTNLGHAIEVESERRAHEDCDIRKWVECNYVPWSRKLDASLLCPPVQLAATAGGASNAQPTNVVVSGTVTTQAATA